MLAACNINGFIRDACKTVERERDGGGTVDTEVFTHWLNDSLVPLLGNNLCGEPHSIVVLDNASIHHSDEIVALIEAAGAIILYLPPYSPDLNPIELMFGQYKQGLKRHHHEHWRTAHMEALASVSPLNACNYFQRCGVPGIPGGTEEEGNEEEEFGIVAATVAAAAVAVVKLL